MNAKISLLAALLLPFGFSACRAPDQTVHIHTTAMCDCCGRWVQQLRAAGFIVEVEQTYDVGPQARDLGVPAQLQSCYAANIESTFLHGEVPPEDIKRVREEFPNAAGLAVRGNANLQVAGDDRHPKDTLLFEPNGRVSVFAHHHEDSPPKKTRFRASR